MEDANARRRRQKNAARARRLQAGGPLARLQVVADSVNSRVKRLYGDCHRLTADDLVWMYETYGRKCLACGSPKQPSIDHVVPSSKGGTNTRDNIQPLCLPCNLKKKSEVIDYRP